MSPRHPHDIRSEGWAEGVSYAAGKLQQRADILDKTHPGVAHELRQMAEALNRHR